MEKQLFLKEIVRRMRSRLLLAQLAIRCHHYAAPSCCHSASAAFLWSTNSSRLVRWRSWLKKLWTDERIETNSRRLHSRLNFGIACSCRRNGRWEFSQQLFFQRQTSWTSAFPMDFMAAQYERKLSDIFIWIPMPLHESCWILLHGENLWRCDRTT